MTRATSVSRLLLESPELASRASAKSAVFYPYTDGMVEPPAPQSAGTATTGFVHPLRAPATSCQPPRSASAVDSIRWPPRAHRVRWTRGRARIVEAEPGPVPVASVALVERAPIWSFSPRCCSRFSGGLILNLMPCVFPVLSMKALALGREARCAWTARASALAYGAGVLVSFVALAGVLIALAGGRRRGRLGLPVAAAAVRDAAGALDVRGRSQPLRSLRDRRRRARGCRREAHAHVGRGRELLHRRARRRGRHALHGALHGRGDGLCADPERGVRSCGVPGTRHRVRVAVRAARGLPARARLPAQARCLDDDACVRCSPSRCMARRSGSSGC